MVDADLLPELPAELLTMRDAMAALGVVESCQIGLEAAISPDHYPLVRLVPSRLTPGRPFGHRTCETLVYFGAKIANSQGLEEVYRGLFEMEKQLLEVIRAQGGRYIETLTDEDRLETYKLMVIRCEVPLATVAPAA